MKKKTLLQAAFAAVLSATLAVGAAAAFTLNLHDTVVSGRSPMTGGYLPSSEISGTNALYNWQDKESGYFYGWNPLPVPTGEHDLYALWVPMVKAKPGENAMKNGTFDGDTVYLRPSNGGTRIVTESDGNRVLEYTRGSGFASLQFYVGWEAGRKYNISYRVKAPGEAAANHNPLYYASASAAGFDHPLSGKTTATNQWVSINADFTIPSTIAHKADDKDGFLSLYVNPIGEVGGTVYYDDISLIPYACVRYHTGGGTGAPADEFLLTGTVAVSDTVPVRRGFIFDGWSLTEGGTNAVDSVTVAGNDIDLYAIWTEVNEQNVISYRYSTEAKGLADGVITVIAPEEAADYTGVSLYFANANGVMSGYTPFATMTMTEGAATYTTTKNRLFAPGATRLSIHFTAEGKEDIVYWYDIPEKHRFDASTEPLFTFYAVSDIHMADYWPEITVNRTRMMNDIVANAPAFTVIAGDLVNNSNATEFQRVDTFLKNNFNDAGRAAFITNGNHEFHVSDRVSVEYDRTSLLNTMASQIAVNRKMGYTIRRDGDALWYSAIIKGRKFIFLSTPSTTSQNELASYVVSKEQLTFLKEELAAAESTGYPAFVVSHVPLAGYVPASGGGISNTADIVSILNDYPGTTVITAHTHSNLSLDRQYVQPSAIGGGLFNHFNDGCSIWLEEGSSKLGVYEVNFSAGQVVDVYADRLVIRARKFAETSEYFGHGLFEVKLPGTGSTVPTPTLGSTVPADGVTLRPTFAGGTNTTGMHYEWLIDGKVYSTEKEYTIEADNSMAGKYVVLRVSDANGNYSYARTEKPFTAVTLHYDANGGTGKVPVDTKVISGTPAVPDKFGNTPQKTGFFFVGWSTDKNATKPIATITPTVDTTLYAVYTDKPFFDFDATLCGWVPNDAVKTYDVKDSAMHYTADPKDMFFTLSGISFSADDHPYMRIKCRYDSGSGDGMFFSILNGSGFSQQQRIPLPSGTVVATLGDMQVLEYDLTALVGTYWKGTVNALRYDVLGKGGVGATDYIAFTAKRGVYDATINVTAPTLGQTANSTVTLSSDTKNCTLESATWEVNDAANGKYVLCAVLAPAAGYEFTTASDALAGVKIPGGKVYEASVDANGKATIRAYVYPQTEAVEAASTGKQLVSFGKAVNAKTVLVASYNADGRPIAVKLFADVTLTDGTFVVSGVNKTHTVKAFAFDSLISLSPSLKEAVGQVID